MDRTLYVNTLTGKHIPLVRLLLAIKSKITGFSFLYFYLAIFKLLGLVILTMSFIPTDEETFAYRVTKILRSLTTFGILGTSLSYTSYTLVSYLSFLILIGSLVLFIYTYKQTKINEDFIISVKARILSIILAILFQVLLVVSQHLIEFFSFIFMIQFNSGVNNSVSPTYYLIKDYSLFMNSSASIDGYLLMFVNLLGIVFLNVFMFFAFKLLNEPFFDSDFPVRMRYPDFSMIMYVVFQNLQCLHYIELFITNEDTLKLYKFFILGIVNSVLIIGFSKTYDSFNFSSKLTYVINFLLFFSFISSVIELSLYFSDINIDSTKILIFTMICKLLISFSFLNISYYINERIMVSTLKVSLFQPYDGRINKSELDSLFYLINLLVKLENQQVDDLNKLMNIILSHKTECVNDVCKCSSINEYKTEILLKELNLILESIFSNLNLGKEQFTNILFAEYLYYQRKSTLFGWSIMNTYISKNTGHVSNVEIYQFFLILLRKVYQFDDALRTTENYIHFNKVFREVALSKFYEKKIIAFSDNFEIFVKFKERFDSSLKVDHNEGKIDSYIFQNEMSLLVDNCKQYKTLYKNMKSFIRKDFSQVRCKSVELGYRLYSFFTIFNKKVPQYILGMICDDSTLDKTSNTAVCSYFNMSMQKFFTNNKEPMNMIIEVNKLFKIKYISNKICTALGHSYSKLINDDLHQLFPLQFREPHKNVLLNHFLIQKNLFFRRKTFGFTSSNNLVALDLMVSSFPNLKKNLQAVVSVYPVETDDKRAFFFVVTEFYELLAISDNLDSIYSLNYEVIDKLGISMVKLFDIESVIATKFKPHLDRIKNERYLKQFDHLYSLSYFLFNLGGDEERIQVQQAPPVGEHSSKKEAGSSLYGGLKGTVNNKDKGKKNKNMKESHIDLGNVGGSDDMSDEQKKDISNTVTPAGVQNNLLEKANKTPQSENSSKAYSNYAKGEDTKTKTQDVETPTKNGHEDNQDIYGDHAVIRDKRSIIQNLEIIKKRSKDMELGYQYYERLSDCVSKLKKSCGLKDDDKVEVSKSNLIRNKFKNKVQSKENLSVSENFHINISFRKINDSPFYLVGIKEKTVYKKENIPSKGKQNLNKDLTVIGETPEEMNRLETQQTVNFNQTPNPDLKNQLAAKQRDSTKTDSNLKSAKTSKKNSTQINIVTSIQEQAEKMEKDRKRKEEEKLKDPNEILDISKKEKKKIAAVVSLSQEKINKQEERQKSERNKEIIITVILGIFLVSNLIVAILVFYFKLYVIQVTQDIFVVNFWRMRHETIFTALHSACLTYAFLLTGITTFQTKYLNSIDVTVPVEALPLVINERSDIVRDTFANFFIAVKSSRYQLEGLEYLLYTNIDTYEGMVLTWDSVQFNKTYIGMVDFVVNKAKELIVETKLDEYIVDINNALLFKQYDNLKNIRAASRHSVLLFFLNENILKLEEIFLHFKEAINKSESDFKDTIRKMTSTIEIMNIVLGFILIIVIHYTLTKFDKNLFKILIGMFLNMRKGKKADFRGSLECEVIKLQMRNLKNLLYSFNPENIRLVDKSLHMDEYGMNKLLMKNYMKNDEGVLNAFLGNGTPDTSAPSKDPLLNATLGGSMLGLNSSQTPLAASKSIKELGLNDAKKDENNNLKEGSEETPEGSEKINTKTVKKSDEKVSSSKKKKGSKEDEPEVESFITNGQIMKRTKHYSIQFVFIAKVVITLVFLVYIIFIISNVISNAINFDLIDSNMALVSSYVMVFPEINRVFNMIRLSIITNDLSYTKNVQFYMDKYYHAEDDSTILYDQFEAKLPESHDYYKTLNELDYEKRSSYVCKGTVVKDFCRDVLRKENGYNKEGLKIATNTVITKVVDIYKDYLKIRESNQPAQLASLTSQKLLIKYFNTEDFGNINCQMCLVFLPTTISYFNAIQHDMTGIFNDVINMNVLLGIASISLNIIIILYIILFFFRQLSNSKDYITYSANKFNKAIFEA